MIIAHPATVLAEFRRQEHKSLDFYDGRLTVALEIVTTIRTLEEIPSVVTSPHESISLLTTLLADAGFNTDQVFELYDTLGAWRAADRAAQARREAARLASRVVTKANREHR